VKFLDKVLLMVMALTLIITLCFLILMIKDLNELWLTLDGFTEVMKSQESKIIKLQRLFISKIGTGI
jgi:hypothetical protein